MVNHKGYGILLNTKQFNFIDQYGIGGDDAGNARLLVREVRADFYLPRSTNTHTLNGVFDAGYQHSSTNDKGV